MKTVALLLSALLLSCAPAAVTERERPPRNTAVAPSAAIVRPGRTHYDFVDMQATLGAWACLYAEQEGDVSIVLELTDPVIDGVMLLTDSRGAVLGITELRKGKRDYELLERIPTGAPSRCVHLQAREGSSVFELRWRYR